MATLRTDQASSTPRVGARAKRAWPALVLAPLVLAALACAAVPLRAETPAPTDAQAIQRADEERGRRAENLKRVQDALAHIAVAGEIGRLVSAVRGRPGRLAAARRRRAPARHIVFDASRPGAKKARRLDQPGAGDRRVRLSDLARQGGLKPYPSRA